VITTLNRTPIEGMVLDIDPAQITDPYDRAQAYYTRAIDLRQKIDLLGMKLGQVLYTIREERLYEQLGHDGFQTFLSDETLAMPSHATAYRMIRRYEVFIRDGHLLEGVTLDDLAEVGSSKASILIPLLTTLTTPEQRQEAIADAKALGARDLRRTVRERLGGAYNALQDALEQLGGRMAALCYRLPEDSDPATLLDQLEAGIAEARNLLRTYPS
jgi:hypothetical protein